MVYSTTYQWNNGFLPVFCLDNRFPLQGYDLIYNMVPLNDKHLLVHYVVYQNDQISVHWSYFQSC